MDVTVLLFASIAQAAGTRKVALTVADGATVEAICAAMVERFPAIERFVPNLLFAVDEEYADATAVVRPGATVALIPPVSGG